MKNNEADWLSEQIQDQKPVIPTFPGRSMASLGAGEADHVRRALIDAGIDPSRGAGISSCGRYAISFGADVGDLRFTPLG